MDDEAAGGAAIGRRGALSLIALAAPGAAAAQIGVSARADGGPGARGPAVSPREFGARADGSDDAPAFQAMIDAVTKGVIRARARIGAGLYRIGSKISFPRGATGGAIDGDGAIVWHRRMHQMPGSASMIVWSGAAGGTLLGGQGVLGISLRDMTFIGREREDGPRAGILFHCEQDRSNANGSGMGVMEQVSFLDADTGVQMGADVTDGNCADWTFVRVTFGWCGIGLRVVNKQGLNYNLVSPNVVFCRSFIRMDYGGSVQATNIQAGGCGGIGDDAWLIDLRRLDDNGMMAVFDGLRIEGNTRQALRMRGGIVALRAYEEGQGPQDCTMVEVRGGTLTIDGARLVTSSARTPHFRLWRAPGEGRPKLHLRNVHFAVAEFRLDEWILREPGSEAIVTLDGCTAGRGAEPLRLGAMNNLLSEAPVRLDARTSGQGIARLAFGGGPYRDAGDGALLPPGVAALVTARIVGRQDGDAAAIATFACRVLIGGGKPQRIVDAAVPVPGWTTPVIEATHGAVTVRVAGAARWTAVLEAMLLP